MWEAVTGGSMALIDSDDLLPRSILCEVLVEVLTVKSSGVAGGDRALMLLPQCVSPLPSSLRTTWLR